MTTTRREYHYYYHGVDRTPPQADADVSGPWWVNPAVFLSVWVVAVSPIFAVGALGAWINEDRLPLHGGADTVVHVHKEVAVNGTKFALVFADNVINGKSTFTASW